MASRDRRGRQDTGLTPSQADMLKTLYNAGDDGVSHIMLEQACLGSLNNRGFVTEGRKRTWYITREGRNMHTGAVQ